MLFFHGGGHVFGGKETHHDFLMYFASLLKIKVYALDYRLAPEFPFPADIEDAEMALNYLHTEKSIPVEDLVLCGDSAGAGVSAGLTTSLILNNKPYPSFQCLIYPMLDEIHQYHKRDLYILIRSFVSRIKRLLELKKLQGESGNVKSTIENFRPPIFWKDKETVEKQLKSWSIKDAYKLFDEITELEINYKKNSNLSNNLIFDLILNSSNN